ncbi:MAG: helix-turn-helix domain-containing protein [Actinomycetota bacterium]|nr:helix-turn-helix domain-containing protein [Actinomycetota bacterium]
MVLLAAEQRLTAAAIVKVVRASEETVRRCLKRYLAEGVARGCATCPVRARRAR